MIIPNFVPKLSSVHFLVRYYLVIPVLGALYNASHSIAKRRIADSQSYDNSSYHGKHSSCGIPPNLESMKPEFKKAPPLIPGFLG